MHAVTALYEESPAVEIYRRPVTIVRASSDVMGMRDAATNMARVGLKLVAGAAIVPTEDGTIPHGLRQNYFADAPGAHVPNRPATRRISATDQRTSSGYDGRRMRTSLQGNVSGTVQYGVARRWGQVGPSPSGLGPSQFTPIGPPSARVETRSSKARATQTPWAFPASIAIGKWIPP